MMTESQGNRPEWLVNADKHRKRWAGKRIAIVDDDPDPEDATFLEALFNQLGLEVGENVGQNGVTLHHFETPEAFVKKAADFDGCFLDGNFGDDKGAGPRSVKSIREENPSIFIVGRSAEDRYNNAFQRLGVELVIPKSGKNIGSIPLRFGEILNLLKEEKSTDWSIASLETLIDTQYDDF